MIRKRSSEGVSFRKTLSGVMLGLLSSASFATDDGSQLNNAFRVNYAGYIPQAAKIGLYLKSNQGVIRWSLPGTDCSGMEDTYISNDKSSGDSFYIIDFSACTTEVNGVRLTVGSDQSAPFDISNNPYGNLKFEFFNYFKSHEAFATFQNAKNNWASGLNLSFNYVKDAGDNGAYPTNTAEAAWALINMLETYPNVNSYYSSQVSGAKTVYSQLKVLTEQFNFTMNNPRRLAIPKFHTNVNSTWAPCSPYTSGTCISEPETKATFATVRSLAAMARLHSVYGNTSDALGAYNLAKTGLTNARNEPFTCNQANKFGGEGGMYPDNDPASLWRDPKSDRDNCVSHRNNTQDDEYAALVELYIAAERLGNTLDAANFKAQVTSHVRFNEASSYWWGAVAMEGNLSLLTNESRHSIDLTTLKINLLVKANEIIAQQEKGYPGVTWNPSSTQWNNGDKDSVDNNVRWGSHRNALNDARIMMAAAEVQKAKSQRTDAARFARGAVKVLDHMFGINAVNLAMFTTNGYPFIESSVSRTHDGADSSDSWPGKLILGPNNWTNANDGAMPAFGSKPGLKMFSLSGTPGWASREVSIDANAALVPVSYFATEVAPAIMLLDPIGGTAPTNPPAAPSSFNAVANSSTSISLRWIDNSGANADAETGFKIYLNTVNSKPANAIQTTSANASSWIATGLTPQTPYFFWVEAFNSLGTSFDATASASTLAGPAFINLVSNGDFTNGTNGWNCNLPQGIATCSVVAGSYFVNISTGGSQSWHIQPLQEGIVLVQGRTYTFAFDARAVANRNTEIKIERSVSPWEDFSGIGAGQSLTTTMQRFQYTFTMNASLSNARVAMNLGNSNSGVYVDNFVLIEGDRDPCNGQVGCSSSSSSLSSSPLSSSSPSRSSSSSSLPKSSTPQSSLSNSSSSLSSSSVPLQAITVQAESYAQMNGIQTELTQDTGGGLNIGWTDAGDWMSYSAINLPCAGTYTIEYRVASGANGGALTLEKAGGSPVFGSINFTGSGGWQTWKTVSHDVVLPAGSMSLGIAVTQGGWNLNWFRVIPKCGMASSTPRVSSSLASSIRSSNPSSSKASISSSCHCSLISSSANSSSSISSDRNRYDAPKTTSAPVIDGVTDAAWDRAAWAPVDVFWLGSQRPGAQDFTGRYKAMWDAGNLYLLFDITDDVLLDATANPLERYWDDDSVEIFIDENKSGGNHQYNTSAWAYHIGTLGDSVDFTNSASAKLLNSHITVRRISLGARHMWEMSMRVYAENYNDNTINTPVALFAGKLMGFTAAYNDNDASSQRESMMGSVDTQGHKDNLGYIDASVFGSMRLIDSSSSTSSSSSTPVMPKTVVLQAEDYIRANDQTLGNTGGVYRQGDVDIQATTDTNGGFNLGWTDAGEWLEFDTDLVAGTYDLSARVASKVGGSFNVIVGDSSALNASVPNTGDWQVWQTIQLGQVIIGASGNRVVRINIDGGFNLNWIQLDPN
jgi:hypothetical protein